MSSCHLLANGRRFLSQLLPHLEVHLLIFFDVLVDSKRGLRVIINLVDHLWRLLLGKLGRLLSLTRRRLIHISSLLATEQEFDLLLHRRVHLRLCRKNHRFVLLALNLRLKLVYRRGGCALGSLAQLHATI